MNNLTPNSLYQILMQIESHPQLFFPKKSLLALDNYIGGYLSACANLEPNSGILAWYHSFAEYIVQHFGEPEYRKDVREVILAHGYDDCSGVDCLFALLKQFAKQNVPESDTKPISNLLPREVRALRFDRSGVCALAQKEISEHPERYFGIEKNSARDTISYEFSFESDGGMVCLVYDRKHTFTTISAVREELEDIPAISASNGISDKERYCVLMCE